MNQKNHFLPDLDFDFDQTDLLVFIAGLVSVAGILVGISAFIENYVPVLILAGLATLALVFFGFLVAIGYLSNRSQYKSAVKTLKKVQSNQVSLVEVQVSDFEHEGKKKSLQMIVDMGLSIFKVDNKHFIAGYPEAKVHPHERWFYVAKYTGINTQYFRAMNGQIENTTKHNLTIVEDINDAQRIQYELNRFNKVDVELPEIVLATKKAKFTSQNIHRLHDMLNAVNNATISLASLHNIQHHFEDVKDTPEFQDYQDIPHSIVTKLYGLPEEFLNLCSQKDDTLGLVSETKKAAV